MTLVIGYGNTLRGDDGVGQVVALQLAQKYPDMDILTPHQLLPELVEPISKAALVIFIDANVEGEPGQITMRKIQPQDGGDAFSHTVSPEGLLAGARDLFDHAPPAWLVTITGQDFDLCEQLSEPVLAAVPSLLDKLDDLLQDVL